MATTPNVLKLAFVASTSSGANQVESVTLSDGTFLVVYNSNDVGRTTVALAQQFSADGTPIGGEMNLGLIGDARLDVTALPGNKIAIVGDLVKASMINADVFEIRDGVAIRQGRDEDVFLFDNDGTFFNPTITGDGADGFDLHFAALESGVTTILDLEAGPSVLNPTNFDFATEIASFTVNNRFRAELDSATLENGNVVLLIDRDGDDGNLRDMDFLILDKDGATVAEGEILSTRGKTFDGTVTALKGGGFVIAMSENDGDIDVRYQVFDENGQAVSGQNPFGTNFTSGSNNNNTPEIVALDDGGFVIFYGKDNGSGQLRGQRFDANGNTVGEDFLVAIENSKDISATALADGRIAVSFETDSGAIKTAIVTAGLNEVGTDGNDVFNGTDGADDFIGDEGDDLFNSKGLGTDLFDGGEGFDTVSFADAPAGRSFIVGLQNKVTAESVTPTFLVERFDGSDSNGAIRELGSTDTLISIEKVILGSGDDTVLALDTDNVFEAGAGNDRIDAGLGHDIASGGTGDDLIFGRAGNDTLIGGDGDDRLFGGPGFDRIEAGDGDDLVLAGPGNDTVFGQGGNDTIQGELGNDRIDGGTGNDKINGGAGDDRIEGGNGSDDIDGGVGSDTIFGGAGNDKLLGSGGFDFIEGGTGSDTISGGALNDRLFGDQGADVIHGDDGNDQIHGGTGNDTLFGDIGDDFIFGDAGNDRIDGGTGNDVLTGGLGTDVFVIGENAGIDTITDYKAAQGDQIDVFGPGTQFSFVADAGGAFLVHNPSGAQVAFLEGFTIGDPIALV